MSSKLTLLPPTPSLSVPYHHHDNKITLLPPTSSLAIPYYKYDSKLQGQPSLHRLLSNIGTQKSTMFNDAKLLDDIAIGHKITQQLRKAYKALIQSATNKCFPVTVNLRQQNSLAVGYSYDIPHPLTGEACKERITTFDKPLPYSQGKLSWDSVTPNSLYVKPFDGIPVALAYRDDIKAGTYLESGNGYNQTKSIASYVPNTTPCNEVRRHGLYISYTKSIVKTDGTISHIPSIIGYYNMGYPVKMLFIHKLKVITITTYDDQGFLKTVENMTKIANDKHVILYEELKQGQYDGTVRVTFTNDQQETQYLISKLEANISTFNVTKGCLSGPFDIYVNKVHSDTFTQLSLTNSNNSRISGNFSGKVVYSKYTILNNFDTEYRLPMILRNPRDAALGMVSLTNISIHPSPLMIFSMDTRQDDSLCQSSLFLSNKQSTSTINGVMLIVLHQGNIRSTELRDYGERFNGKEYFIFRFMLNGVKVTEKQYLDKIQKVLLSPKSHDQQLLLNYFDTYCGYTTYRDLINQSINNNWLSRGVKVKELTLLIVSYLGYLL